MDLRVVCVGDLISFTKEPAFAKLKDLPIIPLRAISQAHNPNAKQDDPALIVAYNEAKEVIAFLGCIPDKIRNADVKKSCWNSGWWAHPEKGNIAVMPVFFKGLQLWEGKMLFDALPERSKEILKRMGHFSFLSVNGILAYGRFKFHKILPARKPALSVFKNVIAVFDQVLNILVRIRIANWKRKNSLSGDIEVVRLDKVDKSTFNFIQNHTSKDLVVRSQKSFNWPIDFPWVNSEENFKDRYHFSSHAKRFENILLTIKRAQKIIAFLWLTYRDGTVKLPYCYIKSGAEIDVGKVIGHHLADLPFEAFICYQKNILETLKQSNFPFTFKKQTTKDFGWSKILDAHIPSDVYIQDGDGDGVFT